jgi:soluble lytic murein transglycosylase
MKFRWSFAISVALAAASIGALYVAAAPDPLADLKSAVTAYESKRSSEAVRLLEALRARLPQLADYVAWFLGSAQFDAKNYGAIPKALEPVFAQRPGSPLVPRAALLAAQSFVQNQQAAEALEVIRKYYSGLPQPQGDQAFAQAFDATGDPVSAAIYYQRVYYGFPLATEAVAAGTELTRLRSQMGDNYPPPLPSAMLGRALKILDAGQNERGRKELESLVPVLGGAERDLAQVRIGVAQYNANQTAAARRHLSSLEVASPEADAERLLYLMQCARRLNNQDEVNQILDQLAQRYPNSLFRMQALTAAANVFLLQNQAESYEPLYRACYESFPKEAQAAGCHWKVAWAHYIRRMKDSGEMLRAHLRLFPASEDAPAALYFLGRLAETGKEGVAARVYYEQVVREYPNLYYAMVARERLESLKAEGAAPAVTEFLRSVAFPQRVHARDFQPNAASQARLDRARMLAAAGLNTWAEVELRFGAQGGDEEQAHILAMELASMISAAKPDQAIRYIKRYAGGYTYLPVESAPLDFWRLAFPLPHRPDIERFARQYGVDPFLMAGLIRQESEFDARVVSYANARGLTQIMPATGKELSRRIGMKGYSTPLLFQPVVNLQLGTYYFKTSATQAGGKIEVALAAYNAGMSRARAWSTWADFREPSEFIETVPFAQTRGYIQAVLRNADVYRRIYGPVARASLGASSTGSASPR